MPLLTRARTLPFLLLLLLFGVVSVWAAGGVQAQEELPHFSLWSDWSDRIVIHWEEDKHRGDGYNDPDRFVIRWKRPTETTWNQEMANAMGASVGDPDAIIYTDGVADETWDVELLHIDSANQATSWGVQQVTTIIPVQEQAVASAGTMYGIDNTSDSLYTISNSTANWTLVGSTGTSSPKALAWDGTTMYGADSSTDALYTVDLEGDDAGTWTRVHATNTLVIDTSINPESLEWDGTNMYLVSSSGASISTVNRTDGTASNRQTTGVTNPTALMWNGTTMYGGTHGDSDSRLFTVNLTNGDFTAIQVSGRNVNGQTNGLAWDGTNAFHVSSQASQTSVIDLTLLQLSSSGSTGTSSPRDMAFVQTASTDASLSSLSITGLALNETFDSATLAYTADVGYATDTINIEATATDSNATITGDTGSQSLVVGDSNNFTITVTAEDTTTTQNYTLQVTRAQNDDSTLSALTISPGTLSPTFDAATLAYTATVDNDVTSVTISATANDSTNATVTGHTGSQSVSVGSGNTFTVTVTAQDASTTEYTITVTRLGVPAVSSISGVSTTPTSVTFTANFTPPNTTGSAETFYYRHKETTEADTPTNWHNGQNTVADQASSQSVTISSDIDASTSYDLEVSSKSTFPDAETQTTTFTTTAAAGISSVTARSVGPAVTQVTVVIDNVGSGGTLYRRHRTSGGADNNGTDVSYTSSPVTYTVTGLTAGTSYIHEVSLESDFSTSNSTTHEQLATTLLVLDTNDEEMWEVTNLTAMSANDHDRGTMPSGMNGLRGMEQFDGWVYIVDDDGPSSGSRTGSGLVRSRTPTTVTATSYTEIGDLPSYVGQNRSLLNDGTYLYNATSTNLYRIDDANDPAGGITGLGSWSGGLSGNLQSAIMRGTKMYATTSNQFCRRTVDGAGASDFSCATPSGGFGLTHMRGMTVFNDRILLYDEDDHAIYEVTGYDTSTPALTLLGNIDTDVVWGASISAWDGDPAAIVDSVDTTPSDTTASVTVTASKADSGGQDFHIRYREGTSGAWTTPAAVSSTTTTATFSLTGLTADTSHQLQASMSDAFPSDDREQVTLTTTQTTDASISGLSFSSTDSNSTTATVTLTNPANQTVTVYLRYQEGSGTFTTLDGVETNGTSVSFTLDGLDSSATFNVDVSLTNGFTDTLTEDSFTTDASTSTISDMSITSTGYDRVSLQIDLANNDRDNMDIYMRYRRTADANWTDVATLETNAALHTYPTITGLLSETEYIVQVSLSSTYASGNQDDTDTTKIAPTITGAEFINETQTTATIQIRINNPDAQNIQVRTSYLVEGSGTNFTPNLQGSGQTNVTTFTRDLTGLTQDTSYEIYSCIRYNNATTHPDACYQPGGDWPTDSTLPPAGVSIDPDPDGITYRTHTNYEFVAEAVGGVTNVTVQEGTDTGDFTIEHLESDLDCANQTSTLNLTAGASFHMLPCTTGTGRISIWDTSVTTTRTNYDFTISEHPGEVDGVTASSISNTEATITVTLDNPAGQSTTLYRRYTTGGTTTNLSDATTSSGTYSFDLDSLTANQSYTVDISTSSTFAAAQTESVTFTTLEGAGVTGITYSNITGTGATATVAVSNPDSLSITIYFRHAVDGTTSYTAATPVTQSDASSVSFTITGLENGTTYQGDASLEADYSPGVSVDFDTREITLTPEPAGIHRDENYEYTIGGAGVSTANISITTLTGGTVAATLATTEAGLDCTSATTLLTGVSGSFWARGCNNGDVTLTATDAGDSTVSEDWDVSVGDQPASLVDFTFGTVTDTTIQFTINLSNPHGVTEDIYWRRKPDGGSYGGTQTAAGVSGTSVSITTGSLQEGTSYTFQASLDNSFPAGTETIEGTQATTGEYLRLNPDPTTLDLFINTETSFTVDHSPITTSATIGITPTGRAVITHTSATLDCATGNSAVASQSSLTYRVLWCEAGDATMTIQDGASPFTSYSITIHPDPDVAITPDPADTWARLSDYEFEPDVTTSIGDTDVTIADGTGTGTLSLTEAGLDCSSRTLSLPDIPDDGSFWFRGCTQGSVTMEIEDADDSTVNESYAMTVGAAEASITGVSASSVLADSATIDVALSNPDSVSTTVYLRWQETGAGTWQTTLSDTTSTTAADFDLSGLSTNTGHTVEASLDNTFPADATTEHTFTTGAQQGSVSSFTTSSTHSGITATITLDNPDGQDTTVYGRYRTPPGSGAWTDTSPASMDTSTETLTFTITGLDMLNYRVQFDTDASFGSPVSNDVTLTNADPAFPSATTARSIDEGAAVNSNVGAPVQATDADGDTITYSKSGADASSFALDTSSGQLRLASGVTIDYSSKNSYTLTMTATDTYGGTGTTTVTVSVNQPRVTAISISGITTSAAVVTTTDNESGTHDVYLRYRPAGGSWSATVTDNGSTATRTFNLSSLASGTKYEVDASLNSTFPAGTYTARLTFDALRPEGGPITQEFTFILTPPGSQSSPGTAEGYRSGDENAGSFGVIDPQKFTAMGVEYEVVRLEQDGDLVTFRIYPCPTTWKITSFEVENTLVDIVGEPFCDNSLGYATWTVSGVTADTIDSSQTEQEVVVEIEGLFVGNEALPDGHRRNSLRDTICALPDMTLGEGACIPIALFVPPLVIVGTMLLIFGVTNPVLLAGAGAVTMTGAAALMIPGPIFIVGFVLAAAGLGAVLLMLRR